MTTATLTKWGNSQGITIPKTICNELGWKIGDRIIIDKTTSGTIELKTSPRRFQRTEMLSIAEIFEGWEGEYTPPSDFPCNGKEVDWGEPRGKEMW